MADGRTPASDHGRAERLPLSPRTSRRSLTVRHRFEVLTGTLASLLLLGASPPESAAVLPSSESVLSVDIPVPDLLDPWSYYESPSFRAIFETSLSKAEALARSRLADREVGWTAAKLLIMLVSPVDEQLAARVQWPTTRRAAQPFACGLPRRWLQSAEVSKLCDRKAEDSISSKLSATLRDYFEAGRVLVPDDLRDRLVCGGCDKAVLSIRSSVRDGSGTRVLAEVYIDFGFGPISGNQTWIVGLRRDGESWVLLRAWPSWVE